MATPRHKSPPPSIPASGPARKSIDKKTSPRGKHTGGEVVYLGTLSLSLQRDKFNLLDIDIVRTRDGQLKITLPDGTVLKRPNPRK
jgi:hypothetical protein